MTILLAVILAFNPSYAADYKAKLEYNLDLNQELKLRVIKIPTEFGMIDYDGNGEVAAPAIGSVIVTETIEDLHINTEDTLTRVLPSGTKFYARILGVTPVDKFQKDGSVEMEFFKLQLLDKQEIYLREQSLQASTRAKKSKAAKVLSVGAYSLAGMVVAPVGTALGLGLSGNIIGLGSGAAPYLYAGSAALGGGLGLAYGLTRKGKMHAAAPGIEITVKPSYKWQLAMSGSLPSLEEIAKARKQAENARARIANECSPGANCPSDPSLMPVVLEILKVKKSSDIYGSPCLKISFSYKNNTKEKLRYSSIVLVDSMGREYEFSPNSIDQDFIGDLPQSANLEMNFAVDFLRSVHYLQVRSVKSRKLLASAKVVLI